MFGPIVRGVKVVMRPPKLEDLPAFVAWAADEEVNRYFSDRFPPSLEQQEADLEKLAKDEHWIIWSLDFIVDGPPVLVGWVGLYHLDWINRRAETFIAIGEKSYWRKGIATEAMQLRTTYAFRELGLNKLKSSVFAGNEGSLRALLKAGYREVGVHRKEMWRGGQWNDRIEFEILQEDWERR